jgi:hypothetical protein
MVNVKPKMIDFSCFDQENALDQQSCTLGMSLFGGMLYTLLRENRRERAQLS